MMSHSWTCRRCGSACVSSTCWQCGASAPLTPKGLVLRVLWQFTERENWLPLLLTLLVLSPIWAMGHPIVAVIWGLVVNLVVRDVQRVVADRRRR